MPIDLDHDSASGDWLKPSRFTYKAGDVGVPQSDATTADELLAFLDAEDSDFETQRRLVRAYVTEREAPSALARELQDRRLR